MMARTTMTTQKKNTMIPGIAYPATVLVATAVSYPVPEASFQPIARGREAGRYPPTSTRAPRPLYSPRRAVHFEATGVPGEFPGFGPLVVGLTVPEVPVEVAPQDDHGDPSCSCVM
jgi:hypothetical protein